MSFCAKCGYVDPPYWRHSRFSYYVDLCGVGDFEMMNPDLYKELLRGGVGSIIDDKHYYYRLNKKGRFVARKAKIDLPDKNIWREEREKAIHYKRKVSGNITDYRPFWTKLENQTKLKFVGGKETK